MRGRSIGGRGLSRPLLKRSVGKRRVGLPFSPLGTGGGDDPENIEVTRVALNTTTGNQDITASGFGTPVAAYFILSANALDNDPQVLDCSKGATDGVSQYVCSFVSRDAATASATDHFRRGATDAVAMILGTTNGAILVKASFSAWITDGVRINITVTNGLAYLLTVVLISGDDITAKVGTVTPGAQDVPVTVSPGFETNALITDTVDTFADSPAAGNYFRSGFGSYDGTTIRQTSIIQFSGQSDPTDTHGTVASDGVSTNNGPTDRLELENITATTFDLTARGADWSAVPIGYLALGLSGGLEAWAGVMDSPTTTGDHDFTGPAFTPSAALMMPTMLSAVDTTNSASGYASGVSIITETDQYSTHWQVEDGVATTACLAWSDDEAIKLHDHTGDTLTFAASFGNFLSNGVRLNFTDVDATARKWPALFIG